MDRQKLLQELEEYLQMHLYLEEQDSFNFMKMNEIQSELEYIPLSELKVFLDERKKPTLAQVLFQFIDQKGLYDVDVYKRAGVDRRHFSKIRSKPDYKVSKPTVLALAIAMELDYDETEFLLDAAGYSLSASDRSDLIIRFFLEKAIYDFDVINESLIHFSLKPIGGVTT